MPESGGCCEFLDGLTLGDGCAGREKLLAFGEGLPGGCGVAVLLRRRGGPRARVDEIG